MDFIVYYHGLLNGVLWGKMKQTVYTLMGRLIFSPAESPMGCLPLSSELDDFLITEVLWPSTTFLISLMWATGCMRPLSQVCLLASSTSLTLIWPGTAFNNFTLSRYRTPCSIVEGYHTIIALTRYFGFPHIQSIPTTKSVISKFSLLSYLDVPS